jgi:hypothetical protein
MINVHPSSLSRLLQDNLPSIVQAGIKCTHVEFFKTRYNAQRSAASSVSLTRSFGTSLPNGLGNNLSLRTVVSKYSIVHGPAEFLV